MVALKETRQPGNTNKMGGDVTNLGPYASLVATLANGTPGNYRTIESFKVKDTDTFDQVVDRAIAFETVFGTPIKQFAPLSMAEADGFVYPAYTHIHGGATFNWQVPGLKVSGDRMDVQKVAAGEATDDRFPTSTDPGHLAGCWLLVTQKISNFIYQQGAIYGFRFGVGFLDEPNRPAFLGVDFQYNNVAVLNYQGCQTPLFDGCNAIYNGTLHAATCVGYAPDSPYANRDNGFVDSPAFVCHQFYGRWNQNGGGNYQPGVDDALDDWFARSIMRIGRDHKINGQLGRYVDGGGAEYPLSSTWCKVSGGYAFYPQIAGRESTAFIVDNIDERGSHRRAMFRSNNRISNLKQGRLTVENAEAPNTGAAIFLVGSIASGSYAPELCTENVFGGEAQLFEFTGRGGPVGTQFMTRKLTQRELDALLASGANAPVLVYLDKGTVTRAHYQFRFASTNDGLGEHAAFDTTGLMDVSQVPDGTELTASAGLFYGVYFDLAGNFVANWSAAEVATSTKPAGAYYLRVSPRGTDYDALTISYPGPPAVPVTAAQLEAVRTTLVGSTTQTGAYTLQPADAGNVVPINAASATAVTIPADDAARFAVGTVLEVSQEGAGQVTVAGAAGVTVTGYGGLKTAGQYAALALRKIAANSWRVTGGVA